MRDEREAREVKEEREKRQERQERQERLEREWNHFGVRRGQMPRWPRLVCMYFFSTDIVFILNGY
jgi:hypothetical protein